MSDAVSDQASAPEPFLRVVRGEPTAEELAALVVALSTLTAPAPAPEPEGGTGWAAYWRGHRRRLEPGAGVWRHSLR